MHSNEDTVTIELDHEKKQQIEHIATSIDKPSSWVVQRAIDDYIAIQAWQIQEIHDAISEADDNDYASDDDVKTVFSKYTNAH